MRAGRELLGRVAGYRRRLEAVASRAQRIRTYNFHDQRVTDHRAERSFPLRAVLDGDLDALLDAVAVAELQRGRP